MCVCFWEVPGGVPSAGVVTVVTSYEYDKYWNGWVLSFDSIV